MGLHGDYGELVPKGLIAGGSLYRLHAGKAASVSSFGADAITSAIILLTLIIFTFPFCWSWDFDVDEPCQPASLGMIRSNLLLFSTIALIGYAGWSKSWRVTWPITLNCSWVKPFRAGRRPLLQSPYDSKLSFTTSWSYLHSGLFKNQSKECSPYLDHHASIPVDHVCRTYLPSITGVVSFRGNWALMVPQSHLRNFVVGQASNTTAWSVLRQHRFLSLPISGSLMANTCHIYGKGGSSAIPMILAIGAIICSWSLMGNRSLIPLYYHLVVLLKRDGASTKLSKRILSVC